MISFLLPIRPGILHIIGLSCRGTLKGLFCLYLKALEIQGFKSFPQKTRLTFEKNITAIVGPNGSGKSNISDAVRWVMGEQSTKALRGGKMEDVIFGGTEKRGQIGFAEVSLVLDNSGHIFDTDASEVMITRRYYRSGDSEYYINRKSCRLRDINELLMDTGLGREGYSIIGQGRIDEILSVKSTDRRDIFEEAAGISRFRHRKEESQKKLQQAEDNLLRINDKISELEMQVEPLKKQSETAKKYLVLRDELRGLEISVWTRDLEELNAKAIKYEADCQSVNREREEAQADLEEYYKKSEVLSESLRGKDIESENVREMIDKAAGEKNDAESRQAVLNATLKANTENIQRIESEIESQEGRSRGIKTQIEQHKARISQLSEKKAENENILKEISDVGSQLEGTAGGVQKQLSELLRAENDLTSALAAHMSRLELLSASKDETEKQIDSAKAEQKEISESIEKAREEYIQTEKDLKKNREDLISLDNMISGYEMRLSSRSNRSKKAEEAYNKLDMECKTTNQKVAMLSEMEKDYAGYSKAVKLVMQEAQRGILKGVCGTVGQLAKTEGRYTVAIETALGGAMQNIVVDNEEAGKSAINFLKNRDGGRATFLPMNTIKGSVLNENLQNEPGFIAVASDLVRYDVKYSGIYQSLLGRTAVSDNLDNAVKIGRKYKNRFRIVTLDGQLVNAGGSMTGGSASRNSGIMSRANELAKLQTYEKKLREECARAKETWESSLRDVESSQKELEIIRGDKRGLEDSLLKYETKLEHCKRELKVREEAEASVKARLEEAEGRLNSAGLEQGSRGEKIENTNSKLDEIRSESERLTSGFSGIEEKIKENRDKRDDVLRENASFDAEINTLSAAVSELERLETDMSGGNDRQRAMIESLTAENEGLLKEIQVCRRRAQESDELSASLRDRLSVIAGEKMELEAERSKRDKNLQEMNKRILDLEREGGRLEQLKISAQLSGKQIIDKLWDTYELSRTAAKQQAQEIENTAEAQRRISQLKGEISKLGNPNIGAIDEYERVSTRYNYLVDQRSDIEKSKDELYSVIGDITSEMKEIFSVKFKEIDDCFRKTFTELFGGGRAALELEDKDDILGCGIEIKVQPPGKSLKTLSLLSGGEKAFVAIALYFAILKVRPTPFVIMDEIESALDEVNNARFAEYMRRLTDKTQFLVITHRRRTMEEADVLYGVTMQEKGVSQVINIDLEEAEKTILN